MLKDDLKAIRDQLTEQIKETVRQRLTRASEVSSQLVATPKTPTDIQADAEEPPVVARLMVEIRSDGSRTVARGALQDEISGETVQLEARGSTPLQLAGQLAKSLLTTPLAAAQLARSIRRGEMLSERQAQQRANAAPTPEPSDPGSPSTRAEASGGTKDP